MRNNEYLNGLPAHTRYLVSEDTAYGERGKHCEEYVIQEKLRKSLIKFKVLCHLFNIDINTKTYNDFYGRMVSYHTRDSLIEFIEAELDDLPDFMNFMLTNFREFSPTKEDKYYED